MRLRNVKGSREVMAANEYIVHEPEQYKGRWREWFGNENPVYIEIGMGKGQFIKTSAIQNPEINYIGIEKYSSVLIRALEKRENMEVNNLVYIYMDAETICNVFGKEEIQQIYLNFSDPWPKERHAKRRLMSHLFLEKYNEVLKPEGKVIFKTDNSPLFLFALEEIKLVGWKIKECTYDLHHSEFMEKNIMTEYEEKFVLEGKTINQLTAYR